MHDAMLSHSVRDHTVEAISIFTLIYFLYCKASRDPYFAFVYLVQSVFLLLPKNLVEN